MILSDYKLFLRIIEKNELFKVLYSRVLASNAESYRVKDEKEKLDQRQNVNLKIIKEYGTESEKVEAIGFITKSCQELSELEYPQNLLKPVQKAVESLESLAGKYKH